MIEPLATTTEDETMVDTVGGRLRDARRRRGWSQLRLAAEAGLGHATVERCERGEATPRVENLEALATALRVEAGWLTFGPTDTEGDR